LFLYLTLLIVPGWGLPARQFRDAYTPLRTLEQKLGGQTDEQLIHATSSGVSA